MKHLKIAATADGGLIIEGYGVPFGGPIKGKDLHGQYFSKKTDFALDLIPDGQRPLLFQHGLDSAVDTAVIGRWGVKKIDDGGVWVRAQLDARSEYINEIKELVNQDALGFSSGTMGHLVKVSSKTGEILKWALVELSLTPNPANPNAYIVRANKSAAAHVKSLFATKHGDHDQSEHGNWASGGGAGGDKGDSKEKSKAGFYGSDHWDKPGMPKTVVVSEMSRDKYDRAILPMPDSYQSGKEGLNGRGAWTAVTTADSNNWLDENDDVTKLTSGLDIPYISAESITSPEAWTFALGFANGTLDLAPSDDNQGNVIEGMSRTRSLEDFSTLSERLTNVNAHSSAATFDSLIATWDDFGPGASKKTLRVKRAVKHGDHDQSEHGNWANGGGSDKDKGNGLYGNRLDEIHPDAAVAIDSFLGYYRPMSDFIHRAGMAGIMTDADLHRLDAAESKLETARTHAGEARGDGPGAKMTPDELFEKSKNTATALRGMLADLREVKDPTVMKNEFVKEIANVVDLIDSAKSNGPDDKFNDYMSGYDVPGYPKSFRVKRSTKHGDHDQSEHGNWATGGGAGDKGGKETSNAPHPGWRTEDIAFQKAGLLADAVNRLNIPEISNVQKLTEEVSGGRHQSVVYATAKSPSTRDSVIEKIRAEGWDAKADPDSKRGVIVKPSSGPKSPDIGGASYPDRESDPVYAAWDSQRQVKP